MRRIHWLYSLMAGLVVILNLTGCGGGSRNVLAGNKIIIAGDFNTFNGTTVNRVARLNQDGTLDASFNIGTGPNASVYQLKKLNSGQLLISGQFTGYNGSSQNIIARLSGNGAFDSGFTTNLSGMHHCGINDFIIQTDGKVVAVGSFSGSIARLSVDGGTDSTFNPPSFPSAATVIAAYGNGQILVGGPFTAVNGDTDYKYLTRLNADGTLDTVFTTNQGQGFNGAVTAITVQSDGKILAGGTFTTFDGNNRSRIVRLNSDGTLDNTFAPASGADNSITTIAVQTDGKILIGGYFMSYTGTSIRGIARLNPTGILDTSFNSGGAGTDGIVRSIAIQPDGRIMIGGGFSNYNSTSRNRIARLNSDGSLDTSFNPGNGFDETVNVIILQ